MTKTSGQVSASNEAGDKATGVTNDRRAVRGKGE